MDQTTEIKKKEESLSALMSRILEEPLGPLNKSINVSMEMLQDSKDILNEIESGVKANSFDVEKSFRSLRNSLTQIKDEVLPDHEQNIQRQFKTLSEATAKKAQESIDVQQRSTDTLKTFLVTTRDTVVGELSANKEMNQRAFAALTQQCAASNESLATGLQKATHVIGNAITAQQRALDASHQTLVELFNSASNDRRAIQQSLVHLTTQHEVIGKSLMRLNDGSTAVYSRLRDIEQTSINAIEGNQVEVTRMLTEQNATLTRHITSVQAQLKTLTITVGVFFASTLGYVAYDALSKFN